MRSIPFPGAEVCVCPDAPSLMRAAADEFVAAAVSAVIERGRFAVALAGGSTPRGLYSLLAHEGASPSREIPWHYMHFFFSDERAVPPDHPDSNFRMAFDALLGRVPVPSANIHRVPADRPARAAAELYELEIQRFFGLPPDRVPGFDLILLGMGADGHTASLFPGTPVLSETRRLVCAHRVPAIGAERITFTFPLINAATLVVFLVTGPEKAPKVREVFARPAPRDLPPAGRVRPDPGRLLWLLDEAAATGV